MAFFFLVIWHAVFYVRIYFSQGTNEGNGRIKIEEMGEGKLGKLLFETDKKARQQQDQHEQDNELEHGTKIGE